MRRREVDGRRNVQLRGEWEEGAADGLRLSDYESRQLRPRGLVGVGPSLLLKTQKEVQLEQWAQAPLDTPNPTAWIP